ncbi:MAG: hypothetical protein M3Q44_06555 [bacterium]|nr:hypothetical protein [bacterium]
MDTQKGFSVIEVILATALFVVFSVASVTIILQGFDANRSGVEQTIANQFATEGIEAARSIKNQVYSNLSSTLCVSGAGIQQVGNVWTFKASGTSDILQSKYTRIIKVCDVERDINGDIVASGGTSDTNTKKITVTVSWNATTARSNSVILNTYLTNWKKMKGGLLVYGNGGTTADTVTYRLFDGKTGAWGTATNFDIDTSATNKALRAARTYSSSTREEKILISRHYNGTAQVIYASVWNGSSWSSTQLSTWNATTFLDVLNFDGTYLANGNFMVVYSDNTVIPKTRIWNGSSWAAQTSLTTLGASQIPTFIIASARPNTDEIMASFYTQLSDTLTEYYSGSAWSAITSHAATAPLTTKRFIDFAWSPNTVTTGALVYSDSATDKQINARIWVANGTGSGAWGTTAQATAQTNNLGALTVVARSGANEFQACNKDAGATPTIRCYKLTFSGSTATWSNPTNQAIAAATDTGIQRSYDMDYETTSGVNALIVYSDNTAIPKLKKYAAGTSTWDAAATNISTGAFTLGSPVRTVRMIPRSSNDDDDLMILIADNNLDLYTIFWDGTANTVYTTPAGKVFSQHGTSGAVTTDFWYDFAWDKL